jgi:gamma-butyrobetaine dioxygenase
VAPAAVEVTNSGDLRVTWSPGGEATDFGAAWLRRHCYSPAERARRRRPVVHWDGSLSSSPPRLSYQRARGSAAGRMALYRQVLDYGFSFLHGVPVQSGTVTEVGALFGLVRPSPYGDPTDDIRVDNIRVDSRVSVGTTMCDFQGPHTDTCWRQSLSGLVFMHCLKAHESGGESLYVDGFTVSERLRAADRVAFELLSTIRLNYASSVDNGDEWRAFGRVISCDGDGNVVGFRFRDSNIAPLDLPEDLIEPVYGALRSLEAVLYDPVLWLRRKLAPGEAVVIDNQRVLHGRSYFDPTVCERHMQHCSVDRDVFHNNYRRLARALGEDDWNQVLPWGVC